MEDENFQVLQRIGSTGILRAEGRNIGWANETWFRASDPLLWKELFLDDYYAHAYVNSAEPVSRCEFVDLLSSISGKAKSEVLKACGWNASATPCENGTLSRLEAARAIDSILNPFERDVNFKGELL